MSRDAEVFRRSDLLTTRRRLVSLAEACQEEVRVNLLLMSIVCHTRMKLLRRSKLLTEPQSLKMCS